MGTGKILSVRNSVVDPYTFQIFNNENLSHTGSVSGPLVERDGGEFHDGVLLHLRIHSNDGAASSESGLFGDSSSRTNGAKQKALGVE